MNLSNAQLNTFTEFCNGKSVFITGGMSFLGKVLAEKLLRTCPGIENIYLLVHPKNGKNITERLKELTTSPIFDTLRENDPQTLRKIILIEGDISKVKLGISEENQELLCRKVSVIIHSASIVRFTEGFKAAVFTNVGALNELLKLTRKMKNLKSFIHISSAYTKWLELDVKEKFHSAAFDPFYIIDLTNDNSDEKLEGMAPRLFGKCVNFYTSTTNFAEVSQEDDGKKTAQGLRFTTLRPSTVVGSTTGWIDVNTEINLVIAVSWKVANDELEKSASSVPVIYRSDYDHLKFKQFSESSRGAWRKSPLAFMHWYPLTKAYRTRLLNYIDVFFTHFMPAVLTEMSDKLKEVNGRAVSSQVQYGVSQLKFIINNPRNFFGLNYEKLFASLNKTNQKNFYIDQRTISLQNIFNEFYQGIRKIHPK